MIFCKEGDLLLKVKKSRFDESYIVYDPTDFSKHTHIEKLEIAYVVKRNVERNLLPKQIVFGCTVIYVATDMITLNA